jgi:hypothetical protein
MKLKPEPIEVDLYVNPKRLTKKEKKELDDFIRTYREKQKKKKNKHKKAA